MNQTHVSPSSILILRIALSGIFIAEGINHLQKTQGIAQRILEATSGELLHSIFDVHFIAVASGVMLLLFGIAFLLGIYTRISALALVILLVPITLTIQTNGGILFGPLWKNVALFGGLIFFIINKNLPYQLI